MIYCLYLFIRFISTVVSACVDQALFTCTATKTWQWPSGYFARELIPSERAGVGVIDTGLDWTETDEASNIKIIKISLGYLVTALVNLPRYRSPKPKSVGFQSQWTVTWWCRYPSATLSALPKEPEIRSHPKAGDKKWNGRITDARNDECLKLCHVYHVLCISHYHFHLPLYQVRIPDQILKPCLTNDGIQRVSLSIVGLVDRCQRWALVMADSRGIQQEHVRMTGGNQ